MRLPALVALVSLLAAGCVTPGATPSDTDALLSNVRFEGVLAEALPFIADDGVTLDAWVFRPDTTATGETVPIIINYSPYWSNLAPPAADGGDAFSLYLIEHFVPRGYAVVLASVRGTGLSEGCFWIGGPREIADTDAMTTFLATQPWSNGNVAAVAKSYDGTVAQMLLTVNNPHLKTIVPVSPISEWYKYTFYGGVPYEDGGILFNGQYTALVSLEQSDDPSSGTYEKTPTRVCDESADVQASQLHTAATGDYSEYWQERNYSALLPDTVSASVFYIHGLQDWNVKPDHLVPWLDELYARNVTVKQWLGQWAHDYPHRDDWNRTLLRWFDSELKGIDTGIKNEPLVQVQDTAGVWRHEDRWPPTRATPITLHPSADGSLADEPGSGTSMYGESPAGLFAGAPAAASVSFSTEPASKDVWVSGVPVLHASVSASSPRATLSAALLLDGKVVDQGFLDLAHRDGLETSAPLVPGEAYAVSLPLYPQDIFMPAGSVLTLVLSSTHPEGAPVTVTPFGAPGLVTIHHGEATSLTLPSIESDARVEEPQPEDLGCWTC